MNSPKSIAEAIERLENAGRMTAKEFKNSLDGDFAEVRKAIDELKPHLERLKGTLGQEAKEVQSKVEDKVRENPWVALGIVGLIFFVIGLILGRDRR